MRVNYSLTKGLQMKKKDVITFFGGTCKTAKALGIKHPSVCGWGYIIPKVRAYEIEKSPRENLNITLNFIEKIPKQHKAINYQ